MEWGINLENIKWSRLKAISDRRGRPTILNHTSLWAELLTHPWIHPFRILFIKFIQVTDQMAFSRLLSHDFFIGMFNMRHEIEESLCAEKKRQNNARERDRIQSINEYFGVLQRAVRPFSDDHSCGVPKVSRLN